MIRGLRPAVPPPRLPEPEPPAWRATPGDVHGLIELVRDTGRTGVARRALLVRLSSLPEDRTRPHHLRLARDALTPLVGADRARLFQLPNADITVVWRGEAAGLLEPSVQAVHHLFADDESGFLQTDALTVLLDLPQDAALLLHAAKASLLPTEPPKPPPRPAKPLDPATLALLETALAQASVDRFIRRQEICLRTEQGFRLAWERRRLSVAELAETMVPEHDPRADPWLFRRLTRTLDRRMLSLMCKPEELHTAAPFSLDLNVAGILAPEFLRFDAVLPAVLRGQVVLNLRAEDILVDPAAFIFARDFAHARGYRLLLAVGDVGQLALLPLRRLGLDLLALPWSAELAAPDIADLLPEPSTLVLGRADTIEALAWGKAHAVRLYQGALVAAQNRK
jgi:hypothetical protein